MYINNLSYFQTTLLDTRKFTRVNGIAIVINSIHEHKFIQVSVIQSNMHSFTPTF